MKQFLFFILLFTSNFIFSQIKISGVLITNEPNDSIFEVNLVVYNQRDSSIIKSFVIRDKKIDLTIDMEIDSNFKIMILSDEFQDVIFEINNYKNLDLGKINLKKIKIIEGVTISKKRKIFYYDDDKLIVNVENTIIGNSNSIIELLSKIPSVQVQNNNISIVGLGNALIYLNGRRINIERLQSIPVSRIQKIEVITNPSAIYDASGNAVINIVTKVNNAEGIQCQLNEAFTIAKHNLNLTSINVNYRKGNLSIFSDFSNFFGTDWSNLNINKSINLPSEIIKTKTVITEENKSSNVYNYRFGIDIGIKKNSNISAQYDGGHSKINLNSSSFSQQQRSIPINYTTNVLALNNGSNSFNNNALNVNFFKTLDTLGSLLFIGSQYSSFQSNNKDEIFQNITYDFLNSSSNKINNTNNKITLFVSQIDYTKNYKNSLKLEIGYKFSKNENSSNFEFKSKQENSQIWETYKPFSNNVLYNEKINSFYFQMNKLIGPIMFQLGNRIELSKIDSKSILLDQKYVDTFYTNFFPTFKIGYRISQKLRFVLSLSSRISRPTFQDFDPFIRFSDTLMSQTGNTKLVPEKHYNLELKTIFKNYSLKISFLNAMNPILTIPVVINSNNILLKQENGFYVNQFTTSLNIPYEYKKFQSMNTISCSYIHINTSPFNSFLKSSPKFYLYSYNTLNIKEKMNLDFVFDYNSSFSNGYLSFKPMYSLGIGLSRYFFKKKLNVNINVNDCLKSYYEGIDQSILMYRISTYSKLNTFYVRFALNFKIGKLKNVTYSNKTVVETENERIKK